MFCGALTSKPYAFKVRPWELRSVDSIDIFDSIGSNIRIDFKGTEILRILPKFRADINDFWISNKIRFFFDSLLYQRLTAPFIKYKSTFTKISWKRSFYFIKSILLTFIFEYGHQQTLCINSGEMSTFDLFSLKILQNNLGLKSFNNIVPTSYLYSDFPNFYRFNSLIKSIKNSNYTIVIGCDTRVEAPTLNLQLRKFNIKNKLAIRMNNLWCNSTLDCEFVSFSTKFLAQMYSGKHKICKDLIVSKNPIFFLGGNLLNRFDFNAIFTLLYSIKTLCLKLFKKTININPIYKSVNDVGILELGLKASAIESFSKKNVFFGLMLLF